MLATVVASEALDEETAYRIVSRVFENLEEIRRMHPAMSRLDPARMAQDGLYAPLHPGAERYFRERGLLPDSPLAFEGEQDAPAQEISDLHP